MTKKEQQQAKFDKYVTEFLKTLTDDQLSIFTDLTKLCAESERVAVEACISAVEGEPELPGPMPDSLFSLYQNGDKGTVEDLLRSLVKLTKVNIIKTIRGES